MDSAIYDIFEKYLEESLNSAVISSSTEPMKIKKVQLRPIKIKGSLCFQMTEYKGNQVFHSNLKKEEVLLMLPKWFEGLFKQVQISAGDKEAVILVSRKGRAAVKERLIYKSGLDIKETALKDSISAVLEHDRKKNYIINEGDTVPFLVDLGVMSKDGRVVKPRYDKFRQINRFLEFIEDIVDLLPCGEEIRILDFGCGKSYLTFAMYYYLREKKGYAVKITGMDLKEDVIRKCNDLKERYGYDGLEFICGDIASYKGEGQVDMVVTLHACDTATDYAIYKAVEWGASVILAVPCCQHEINERMSCEAMKPVMKHGLIKERMSALITDAVRAECLDIKGYKTQVLEFIDMEHTPKNILIRAVKSSHIMPQKLLAAKKRELALYMKAVGITQKLAELFGFEEIERADV